MPPTISSKNKTKTLIFYPLPTRATVSFFYDKISIFSLFYSSPPGKISHILDIMHYFGTDGIRDYASSLLEEELPFYLGKALARKGGKIIIARDVRAHSSDIEKQLCKGLLEGATQIWLAGVLPTPALAYTAQSQKADYAVMITASHNPPCFNGLKVFGKGGNKLSTSEEMRLDEEIFALKNNKSQRSLAFAFDDVCSDALTEEELSCGLNVRVDKQNHRIRIVDGAEFLYAKHVKSLFPRFDGYKVRLDCARGCFATLAPQIFSALGAIVYAENDIRDGENVNVNCGCTHIENYAKHVKSDEIGFSFDGDGDRVIAVVDGKIYDGDGILLALSTLYRLQGKLKNRFVVGTILTGTKLQRELAYHNTALLRTDAGDKHVLDALISQNLILGGEKSGHIIMLDKSTTGDGLITALSLLQVKRTLGSIPKYTPYPVLEFNVPSSKAHEEIFSDAFQTKINTVRNQYSKQGRLIVRPSGTEPYIRITYECFTSNYEKIFKEIKGVFGVL